MNRTQEPATATVYSRPHVRVSRSAKGGRYWEVRAFADTLEEAMEEAVAVDRQLEEEYEDENRAAEIRSD